MELGEAVLIGLKCREVRKREGVQKGLVKIYMNLKEMFKQKYPMWLDEAVSTTHRLLNYTQILRVGYLATNREVTEAPLT